MKRFILTEEEKNVIRDMHLNELNKTTYNSAAAKAVDRGDEDLAIEFLKHSNEMGIDPLDDEMKKLALQYVAAYDGGEMKKVFDIAHKALDGDLDLFMKYVKKFKNK